MSNLTANKFQSCMYQANLSTAIPCLTAALVYNNLPAELKNILDADPVMLPLPPDAPADIPRGQFRDKANAWNLIVTANTLTLRWTSLDSGQSPLSADDFFLKANSYLKQLRNDLSLKICRIAVVHHFYFYVDTAAKELAKHFCKNSLQNKSFNRPENFEISSHKVFDFSDNIKVNSWVRNRSAKTAKDNKDIAIVEIDFNTLAEEMASRLFDDGQIETFFAVANHKAMEVLSLYYPLETN